MTTIEMRITKKMKKIANTTTKSKSTVKMNTKEEILPDWFDKEVEASSVNEEEKNELDKLIDSLV